MPGERFEYELNQLLRAVREGRRLEEVDVATVYLDENASSHFRPVVDSIRVYAQLLAFSASSLLGFLTDTVVLLGLMSLTGSLVVAAVVARLASASLNYEVNRRWVFANAGHRSGGWRAAARYAGLASGILVVNVLLLDALVAEVGSVLVAKVATEVVLFVVSFVIQRHVVFARPHRRSTPEPMVEPIRAALRSGEPVAGSAPLSTSR